MAISRRMALKLGSYLFTGPFPLEATKVRSNQQPVVYAIIVKQGEPWAPSFRVLYVGFSEDYWNRFFESPFIFPVESIKPWFPERISFLRATLEVHHG